jgi:hypothetical protein
MQPVTTTLKRSVVLTVAALALHGCASLTVSSYVERGADLGKYHTYAWGPADTASTGDPRLDSNPFFDTRVRGQVEAQLNKKGFERTKGSPDLLVHYHASVTQQIDTRNIDRNYTSCQQADCKPFVFEAGTLFVDLVDPRTNALVWRGWAEGSVEGLIDRQEWIESHVDNAVRKILQRLPNGL